MPLTASAGARRPTRERGDRRYEKPLDAHPLRRRGPLSRGGFLRTVERVTRQDDRLNTRITEDSTVEFASASTRTQLPHGHSEFRPSFGRPRVNSRRSETARVRRSW